MLKLSLDKSKYSYEYPICHNRLSAIGKLILSSRFNTVRKYQTKSLSKISEDKRYHSKTKKILTEASEHNPEKGEVMTTKMAQLIEKMNKLQNYGLKNIKYEGHIRIPTVYNDYHSASTNPGYSRKPDGGIYPK